MSSDALGGQIIGMRVAARVLHSSIVRLEPATISYADYLRKTTAFRRDAERSGVRGIREAAAKRDLVATRASVVNALEPRESAGGIAGRIGAGPRTGGTDLGWQRLGDAPSAGHTISYTYNGGLPKPVTAQPVRGNAVDVLA